MKKQDLLSEIIFLSKEDKLMLFSRWMGEELIVGFTPYIQIFVKTIGTDKKMMHCLEKVVHDYYDPNGKLIKWLTGVFLTDMTKQPMEVARMYKCVSGNKSISSKIVARFAGKIKRRVAAANKYRNKQETSKEYRPRKPKSLLSNGIYDDAINETATKIKERKRQIAKLASEPYLVVSRYPSDRLHRAIAPYRSFLERADVISVVDELLVLHCNHLDVPSLYVDAGKSYETEPKKIARFPEIYNTLKDTSLYDHTCNVVEKAIKIGIDAFPDGFNTMCPVILTAALAHDIGKIPQIRTGSLVSRVPHQEIGAAKLRMMLSHVHWGEKACNAVFDHHKSSNDPVTRILMDAEAEARVGELADKNPAMSLRRFRDWFNPQDLAEAIKPVINVLDRKRHWQAMHFNSVVYVMYGHLFQCILNLAMNKGILDPRFIRQSFEDMQSVLTETVDILRDHRMLGIPVDYGKHSRKFQIIVNHNDIKNAEFSLVPLSVHMFNELPSAIDARKTDYLKLIRSVRAVGM